MNKFFIVGNWKCNPKSLREAKIIFNSIRKGIKNTKKVEVTICPPFTSLAVLSHKTSASFKMGAQNCFWGAEGPFTGEISTGMLRNLGCKYVIIGHSERRQYFKEFNGVINKKIKSALQSKLRVILCIGETGQENKRGEFSKVIKSQIEKGLKKISRTKVNEIAIAYEPVWAIGPGKACRPVQVQVTVLLIRKILTKLYNKNIAENIRILYGGSVNKDNAVDYLRNTNINGLLIGGASLRPKEFIKIVKDVSKF